MLSLFLFCLCVCLGRETIDRGRRHGTSDRTQDGRPTRDCGVNTQTYWVGSRSLRSQTLDVSPSPVQGKEERWRVLLSFHLHPRTYNRDCRLQIYLKDRCNLYKLHPNLCRVVYVGWVSRIPGPDYDEGRLLLSVNSSGFVQEVRAHEGRRPRHFVSTCRWQETS